MDITFIFHSSRGQSALISFDQQSRWSYMVQQSSVIEAVSKSFNQLAAAQNVLYQNHPE